MKFFEFIRKLFQKPSAEVIAQHELEEAKRLYLQKQSEAEYAAKMVEYYGGVIRRLSTQIQDGIVAQK